MTKTQSQIRSTRAQAARREEATATLYDLMKDVPTAEWADVLSSAMLAVAQDHVRLGKKDAGELVEFAGERIARAGHMSGRE